MESISVIIACRNEVHMIGRWFASLERQTVKFQTVIADGLSEDGTRAVLQRFAARHPSVALIDNDRRTTAAGLNQALHASSGQVIVRMDAHTEYAPDYVAQCVTALERTGATNVGGPAGTRAEGYFQGAVARAFHSPFFSGGARFHDEAFEGAVDTVPYGCWRRATLERLGGFDEALIRNQDDELNLRISRAGGVIWQCPAIRSWYFPRSSPGSLARQYFQYGFWKVAILRKHGALASWRHAAPATALVLAAVLAMSAWAKPSWRPVLGAMLGTMLAGYGAASIVASIRCLQRRPELVYLPLLPSVFPLVHVSYAVGFLCALARDGRAA